MPIDDKLKKARGQRAKATIETLSARGENFESIFDKKDDGVKWERAKADAEFNAKSMNRAPVGHAVDEKTAIAAANNLRSQRRFSNPTSQRIAENAAGAFIGDKHVADVPKSELKPLAKGDGPKLKADESIRQEAAKTFRERRAVASRRLAVRGGGEDRRQALAAAIKERKGGGFGGKVGGTLGIVSQLPSMVGKAVELKKAMKGKSKPTLGEGMRILLDIPQKESSVLRQLRKEGKARDI